MELNETMKKSFQKGMSSFLAFVMVMSLFVSLPQRTLAATPVWTTIINDSNLGLSDFAIDSTGNLYVASYQAKTIKKFDSNGNSLGTLSDGVMDDMRTVAVDGSNNVYANDMIIQMPQGWGTYLETKMYNASTQTWTVIGSNENGISAYTPLATNSAGDLYAADPTKQTVVKYTGGYTAPYTGWTVIGGGNTSVGGVTFAEPKAITVDNNGNVYMIDNKYGQAKKIWKLPSGQTTWEDISYGTTFSGPNSNPYDIAIDSDGNLFVADVNLGAYNLLHGTTTWKRMNSTGTLYPTNIAIHGDKIYMGNADKVWSTPLHHTVTYDANGGTGTVPTDSNSYISAQDVTVAGSNGLTKSGFAFAGWSDGTTTYQSGETFEIPGTSVTLSAVWKYPTVTFDSQGGSAVSSQPNVTAGATIDPPTDPTKPNYAFGGWYKESTCTNQWNFATDTVNADTTLYAKWIANTYAVTYDSQGGSAVSSDTGVASGTKIVAPTAPTKSGHTFAGWYKDVSTTNAWDFDNDTVTSDITLYAKWTKNPASGITVTNTSKSPAENGKNSLTITTAVTDSNHTLYYRIVNTDPTAPNEGDSITVGDWTENTNGTNPFDITVADGKYIEVVEVTSADNKITKWGKVGPTDDGYTPSTNADLSNLAISEGALDEPFVESDGTFYATVPSDVTTIQVTPTTSSDKATVTVDSTAVTSNTASADITLSPNYGGVKVIKITVTAEDGTLKDYYLYVTRSAVKTTSAINVASTSATVGGEAFQINYGDVSERGFEYSTAANLASSTKLTDSVVDAGVFTKGITGLTPNTTYYYRAYAKYSIIYGFVPSNTFASSRLLIRNSVASLGNLFAGNFPSDKLYYGEIKSFKTSSASGGGGATSTTEKITVDVDGKDGQNLTKTDIERTKETDGTVKDKVTLPENIAKDTVQKAKEQGETVARIIIPDADDKVSETRVDVPKTALNELNGGKLNLEIYTENAKIQVPTTSLETFVDDLYFRLVPIKKEEERKVVETRAKQEEKVKEVVNSNTTARIEVLGRPMEIETNMQSRPVTLVLPLPSDLPADAKARQEILDNLAVFIEHSDGTKEVLRGRVVEYKPGVQGVEFGITKFSTFTMLYMEGADAYFAAQEQAQEGSHTPYIRGYKDGTFRPTASVTRAQTAAMLARNLGFTDAFVADTSYSDTTTSWAKNEIEFVKQQGIMVGMTNNTFNPNAPITRAQMATLAVRWIDKQCEKDSTLPYCVSDMSYIAYKDVQATHWAAAAIEHISHTGIMTGFNDGTFGPNEELTRAQAVKVLNRLFGRGPLNGVETPTFKDVPMTHWAIKEIEEASRMHQYKLLDNGEEQFVK